MVYVHHAPIVVAPWRNRIRVNYGTEDVVGTVLQTGRVPAQEKLHEADIESAKATCDLEAASNLQVSANTVARPGALLTWPGPAYDPSVRHG